MKKFLLTLFCSAAFAALCNAQTIAAVRQMPVNSVVTVSGIVTNGTELGTIRYLQDATGGIAIYGSNLSSVQRGDSITATGTLTDYNGLLEIQPVTSFTVFTPTGPQPVPQVVQPVQIDEPVEAELVTVNQAVFAMGGSPIVGNTSYTFTANAQQGVIYVRNGSPLVGFTLPLAPVDLTAIASQFYTTYQLLPRDAADFSVSSGIWLTTPVVQSNITQSGFTLDWTTNISGSTFIRYGHTPALELGVINGATGITHSVTVPGAAADIFFAQAFSVNGNDTAYSSVRSYATVSASQGWIKVYFNKSVDTTLATSTNAEMLFYAIDDTLISYINRAQHSIDFTIYHWDNTNLSNISVALNNAYNRGVNVRIIVDGSYVHPAVTQLDPNIPVLYSPVGGNYNIMHNKFVVFDAFSANPDEAIVWTGSTNFSDGQVNVDPNNVIIFQDQSMAKGYTIEFEEMWGSSGMIPDTLNSRFGPYKINNTPHEYLVGGIRVEQYFSPSDGVNAKLHESILSADDELCISTMLITRTDLAADIGAAVTAGVDTYVMVDDASSTTTWSTLQASVPAADLIDYSLQGIMHHKYMIADPNTPSSDPLVVTGCHNWSTSADTRNDENTVIVHDATIANIYYQEFVPRFNQSGGTISVAESQQGNTNISVFPNPAEGSVAINYTLTNAAPTTLTITDVTGKVVFTAVQPGLVGANTFNCSVAGFTAGVYFINVLNDEYSATSRLIVE